VPIVARGINKPVQQSISNLWKAKSVPFGERQLNRMNSGPVELRKRDAKAEVKHKSCVSPALMKAIKNSKI